MSLKKQEVGIDEYIKTGTKNINGKQFAIQTAQSLTKGRLLWITIKAFKTELLVAGNVLLVLNWAFPEWTQLLKSII